MNFLSNLIRLTAPSHHTSNISPRPAAAPDSKTSTTKKMSIQFAESNGLKKNDPTCWFIVDDERDGTLAAHHVHETWRKDMHQFHICHNSTRENVMKTFDVNSAGSVDVNLFNHSIQIVTRQLVVDLSQNVLQGLRCNVAVPCEKMKRILSFPSRVYWIYLPCRTIGKRPSAPFASPRHPLRRGCRKRWPRIRQS